MVGTVDCVLSGLVVGGANGHKVGFLLHCVVVDCLGILGSDGKDLSLARLLLQKVEEVRHGVLLRLFACLSQSRQVKEIK